MMTRPHRDYQTLLQAVSSCEPFPNRTSAMETFVEKAWAILGHAERREEGDRGSLSGKSGDRPENKSPPMAGISWLGFYLDLPDEPEDRRLVLGPHRDKPACSPIGLHGVCGRALTSQRAVIVDDVTKLGSQYVCCDPRDRSELVIPLIDSAAGLGDRCYGVLDVDSHEVGAFDETDEIGLTAALLAAGLTRARGTETSQALRV